jgi:hypothetical protein
VGANDGILDVALDCVILMDESGRIVQFNPVRSTSTRGEAVGHLAAFSCRITAARTVRG